MTALSFYAHFSPTFGPNLVTLVSKNPIKIPLFLDKIRRVMVMYGFLKYLNKTHENDLKVACFFIYGVLFCDFFGSVLENYILATHVKIIKVFTCFLATNLLRLLLF